MVDADNQRLEYKAFEESMTLKNQLKLSYKNTLLLKQLKKVEDNITCKILGYP